MKKTGLNIDTIARKAGYKRVTYYSHIKQRDLNLSILEKYGRAINHDFSSAVPALRELRVEEDESIYAKESIPLETALKQLQVWKEKYYELMEKYIKLVEKDKHD